MHHGAHDVLLHGALRYPVERRDVLLLHVLQAKEDKDVAGQLVELPERLQHLREGGLPIEHALRRALIDEPVLELPSPLLLHRRARDGRMAHRMAPGILEKIRGDLEDITLRMLDHLALAGADDAQQRILHQILRLGAILDAAQEIAEQRRGVARCEIFPAGRRGDFVGEWAHAQRVRDSAITLPRAAREIERRPPDSVTSPPRWRISPRAASYSLMRPSSSISTRMFSE